MSDPSYQTPTKNQTPLHSPCEDTPSMRSPLASPFPSCGERNHLTDLEVGLGFVVNTAKDIVKRSRHGVVDKDYVDRAIQLLQDRIGTLELRLNAVDGPLSDSDEIGSADDVMRDQIEGLKSRLDDVMRHQIEDLKKRLARVEAGKATKKALNYALGVQKTEFCELIEETNQQIDDVSSTAECAQHMAKANKKAVEDIVSRLEGLEELTKQVELTTDHFLDFNDKYLATDDLAALSSDLSVLGEELAKRFEIEDEVIATIRQAIDMSGED